MDGQRPSGERSQQISEQAKTLPGVLRLMADTCIWLDLARNISGEPLIAACRVLTHQGRLELLVPPLVIDEFERNQARVQADMTRSLSASFSRVRAAIDEYGQGHGRATALDQLDDLMHRVPLMNQMAVKNFGEIRELLNSGHVVELTPAIKDRVLIRALEKRAPFHRGKNSVADALLIELYADITTCDGSPEDAFRFVTSNTKDFSLPDGDTRQPHPDLAPFFANPRSHYHTSLATALSAHFPDEQDDLFAELDYHEEPRSLDEIRPVLDKLWDQVWYNRHKNLEYRIRTGEVTVVDDSRATDPQRTVTRGVWERAQAAARRREEQYGVDELGPWSDFDWGMLSGKMSALRWVLGEDWESTLDT